MQVVVWIVIILVAVFLIWLLRKWLKRIIFVVILLVLAFFIYGLFSPSGASRLWYNVRTFPQRVNSWISDKTTFMDYDTYKLDISSVGVKDNTGARFDSTVLDTEDNVEEAEDKKERKTEKVEQNTIQSFSGLAPQTLDIEQTTKKSDSKNTGNTGYSKADLLGIVGKYVENNLDDDTAILVTVEYKDDVSNPEKIILQTQDKSDGSHSASTSRVSLKNWFGGLRKSKSETITVTSGDSDIEMKDEEIVVVTPVLVTEESVKNTTTVNSNSGKKTYNGLTQSEVKETEEIFGILF